jgi:hypothetical protein
VTSGLLLASDTVPPLVFVRVTVHALDPAMPRVAGEHVTELMAGGAATEMTKPPVPANGRASPAGDAAMVSVIPNADDAPAEGDRLTLMTATTPFWIVFAFKPTRTHLWPDAVLAQAIDLPAAVAAVPATALMERISLDEYCVVHCSAAGWFPEEVRLNVRLALPPDAVAVDSDKVLCASSACDARRATAKLLGVGMNEFPCQGAGPRHDVPSVDTPVSICDRRDSAFNILLQRISPVCFG